MYVKPTGTNESGSKQYLNFDSERLTASLLKLTKDC